MKSLYLRLKSYFTLSLILTIISFFFIQKTEATTIVPFPNLGDMAQAADAVVVAKANSNFEIREGDVTYFRTSFTVQEPIKGTLSENSNFELQAWRQIIGDKTSIIWGDAEFREGKEYLIFLYWRDSEPHWQPMMLSFGIFEREKINDKFFFIPSKESTEIELMERADGIVPEPMQVYEAKPLVKSLREIVGGESKWDKDKVVADEDINQNILINRAPPVHCTYLNIGGNDTRYTGFPADDIIIYGENDGDNSFADPDDALIEVENAIDDMEASYGGIDWTYSGPMDYTPTCAGGTAQGGNFLSVFGSREAIVVFNDPCNQIADLVGCSGTLAVGGLYAGGTHNFDGLTWTTGYNSYVIMNNDIGPLSGCNTAVEYKIILIHELSHGLGIGHIAPASGAANMNPSCCNTIQPLDVSCLDYTYPAALPVELIEFTPRVLDNGKVDLKWSTASEQNAEKFVVERSYDGRNFSVLKNVEASGNSIQVQNYKMTDDHPKPGINYYRLKMVDFDGKVEYSGVRLIEINSDQLAIIDLSPNPAQSNLEVRFNLSSEQVVSIKVVDTTGKTLKKNEFDGFKGLNFYQVGLEQIEPGIYLVVVEDESGMKSTNQFVKH